MEREHADVLQGELLIVSHHYLVNLAASCTVRIYGPFCLYNRYVVGGVLFLYKICRGIREHEFKPFFM